MFPSYFAPSYFSASYFPAGSTAPPGSMSARLYGSCSITALLTNGGVTPVAPIRLPTNFIVNMGRMMGR